MEVFLSQNPNGEAVILCPGGGYINLSMKSIENDITPWLNKAGLHVVVLKYRMPNQQPEIPRTDALQAMRIIKSRSAEWNITQLGIMGASAGGHLASSVATQFTQMHVLIFKYFFTQTSACS